MSTQNLLNERDYLINNDQSDEKKHVLEIEDTQYDQIGGFGKYMADLQNSWRLLCLMAFISLLITLFYLFLLRWITKPLLYISLFLILICGAVVSYLAWNNSKQYDPKTD
jgi:hypothetical protein